MPHVNVKLATGRSEEQKRELTRRIVEAVTSTVGCDEDAVSVAIQDVPMAEWNDAVYVPEIEPSLDGLYKKPGYGRPG
ncbi:hypothetical protein GCM10011390_21410 [Aureimonas endophytica]|uniref:4-oxalocrotonate tautomerase-like domain-containing protein n=2 Tax=Aureimonas endophytica TaxID=2027858 RepID=A0A916ZL46_9HYPH|nr:hypothetical protein GCM10011390_21410 [Aureimonas endophytica]